MTAGVSVVIPTKGRPGLLRRCLIALLLQQTSTDFEIIVVDDGPDPETARTVEALARKTSRTLRYFERLPGKRGPAAARNQGWRASLAPVIAFTDDDTVPARNWLDQGCRLLQGPVVSAYGRVRVPISSPPTDYELDQSNLEKAGFVTANCFVRRDALEAIGGFDERFLSAWREDSDLFFRLRRSFGDHAIVPAPRAKILHPVRRVPWGISLRLQKKAQYNALLYKKHPGLYKTEIQSHPPVHYYLALLTMLIAAFGLLSGARDLAFAGAFGWILWTLLFTARRLRGTELSPSHIAEMLVTSALIPILAVFWRLVGAWRYRVLFF